MLELEVLLEVLEALLVLLPLMLSLHDITPFDANPALAIPWIALVALLMASRSPTPAARNVRIHPRLVLPVMLGVTLLVVLFLIEPWRVLSALCGLYLVAIPLYAWRREQEEEHDA